MTPESPTAPSEHVAAFFQKHRTGLVALVFTDLVDSVVLLSRLGDQAGTTFMQRRRQIVREVLQGLPEGEEIETAGDSFLLAFAKPSDAVRFALQSQMRLRHFSAESGVPVQERIGIHLGEVVIAENEKEGKAKDFYGLQLATCFRVMSLAAGGQVLLTRGAFDSARQVLKGEDLPGLGGLQWASHGPYLLKGLEEAVEVCEVGEAGQSPRAAPKTSDKAQRQVRPDEEPVLGWRPAVGQEVPNTKWVLEEKLGEGGFGEVWVGRHQTLKAQHVFKFCFRADRVRSLKREATLFRLLKERVGEHPNVVRIHDVYFDQPPFYLEEDYVPGKDLRSWCEAQGGIAQVPLEVRLEIVAQAAEALQAAHEAGIIHRDVKPGNILVSDSRSEIRSERPETGGQRSEVRGHADEFPTPSSQLPDPTVKLTDFGIGQVISAEFLAGVTKAGFTQTILGGTSSGTGTAMYLAPEIIAGHAATTRSDLYSLGVVLYQLLVGDFRRPLTADWARQVADPLLREDLEHCFAGSPEERYARAGQLAVSLRSWKQRCARRREQEQRRTRHTRLRRWVGMPVGVATLVVLLVFLITVVFRPTRSRDSPSPRNAIRSIAVLPLKNLSGDAEQEYFADGMTESLITDLAQVGALKVISHTSAMQYKKVSKRLPQIAQELGVDAVIEGSVQKVGQRILISIQLIDVQTDAHLWAESYERDYQDILSLRREIARAIAREVQVALTPSEQQRLMPARPVDPEAYDLCQRGKWYFDQYLPNAHELAKGYFEQAIQKDPQYAEAHACLANYYGAQAVWGHQSPRHVTPLVQRELDKALELDPRNTAAQILLGTYRFWLKHDWKGAEEAYRTARELSPNDPRVRSCDTWYLSAMGRHREALERMTIARALDPLNPANKAYEANLLFYMHRLEEARRGMEETLNDVKFPATRFLWTLYWIERRDPEALAMCQEHFRLRPNCASVVQALARGWAEAGYAKAMRLAAEDLVAQAETRYAQPTLIAQFYVHAGQKDQALDWLRHAVEIHDPPLVFLNVDPNWNSLRSDPRFDALLKDLGLPTAAAGTSRAP